MKTATAPMTKKQKRELAELCEKTGEHVESVLTKAQARCRIDALKNLKTLPRR